MQIVKAIFTLVIKNFSCTLHIQKTVNNKIYGNCLHTEQARLGGTWIFVHVPPSFYLKQFNLHVKIEG